MRNQTFVVWAVMMGVGIELSSWYYVSPIVSFVVLGLLCGGVAFSHLCRYPLSFVVSTCLFFLVIGYVRGGQGDWTCLPPVLYEWADRCMAFVQRRLHCLGMDDEVVGLLEAMMLGRRSGLPTDVRQLYADSGSAHILALSGLHLSILFALLNFWMLRLLVHRWLRYAFGFAGIGLIWGYTLLTGFSPSLTRASIMMSLLLLSQMRLCGTDGWHTLGVAAFLILLFSPSSLWSVGFQLSFASVAGLFLFYGPLQGMWKAGGGHVLRWLWQGWSVSLAAQLGSLPLVVYYFHRISVYAVIFGPVYVLLATLILYTALLALVFGGAWSPLVTLFVACQHLLMQLASSLPGALLEGLYPSIAVVILEYMAIGCLYPVLWAVVPQPIEIPRQRLASFFRQWPYIVAGVMCLLFAYVISV